MSTPPCPQCGSNSDVTDRGREGGSGPSQDVWECSKHGEFRTPAR